MGLPLSQLEDDLEMFFTDLPGTAAACADAWGGIYVAYAAGAISPGGGGPGPLAAAQAALAAAFLSAAGGTSAAATAAALSAAFTAFWLTPPVSFAFTPPNTTPGAVTLVSGTAALQAAIAGMPPAATRRAGAEQFAAAIHAFTMTVVVTHPNTPPVVPPVVGPIS